tara:strand:- start:130 stop:570 length:441 start_codon:yes stop_codon:yes gene_type:complete
MTRKLIKPVVDFNALTPQDIFDNLTHHYDCTGRLSLALFGFPMTALHLSGLRGYNSSGIQIEFDCATMLLFEQTNCKFGLRPNVDGYDACRDNKLVFSREHKDLEKNQDIEIICKISSWNLSSADKEEFDKQFEMISFPEDEKEGV